jgi:hypothetical protein
MDTDSHMERVFSGRLDNVLVGTDTSGFQSFRRDLLLFVREQVDGQRELIDIGLFATQVKDTDLGVRDTTTESGLGVRLVLAVSVATVIMYESGGVQMADNLINLPNLTEQDDGPFFLDFLIFFY